MCYLQESFCFPFIFGYCSFQSWLVGWDIYYFGNSAILERILERQIDILICIRSVRESNFQLHALALHTLMKSYFALQYYNYSRWLTVHLLNPVSLEQQHPVAYKNFYKWYFSYNKSYFQSSTIALDQLYEQSNDEIIKIIGGQHVFWTEENSQLCFVRTFVEVKSSTWLAVLKKVLIQMHLKNNLSVKNIPKTPWPFEKGSNMMWKFNN